MTPPHGLCQSTRKGNNPRYPIHCTLSDNHMGPHIAYGHRQEGHLMKRLLMWIGGTRLFGRLVGWLFRGVK